MLRKLSLSVMTFTYFIAGIEHFARFEYYLSLVPPFFPQPGWIVAFSGAGMMVLAFLLPFRATRRLGCYGLLLLLGISLPLDVYVLFLHGAGIPLPYWVLALRAPFHLLLAVWAWWHSIPEKSKG